MLFDTAAAALAWLGLIVFAVSGALVASRKRMDVIGFALLGTVTGIGGGTVVLSREVYVTAALIGATAFVVLTSLSVAREGALVAGLLAGFAVRGAALHRGWSLPRYRERPGRTLDEIKGLE